MSTTDLGALVDEYVRLYNAKELKALEALFSPDVHVVHRNRGVDLKGIDPFMETTRQFAELLPDRAYAGRRSLDHLGDASVVVRHSWSGTAAQDIPGFGATGDTVGFDLATFFTVENGLIVEMEDYG